MENSDTHALLILLYKSDYNLKNQDADVRYTTRCVTRRPGNGRQLNVYILYRIADQLHTTFQRVGEPNFIPIRITCVSEKLVGLHYIPTHAPSLIESRCSS